MLSRWFQTPVGIDPPAADRLRRDLEAEAAELQALAERVQATLNEAGIASTAPAEIRDVGGRCGGTGADLGRRIRGTDFREAITAWTYRGRIFSNGMNAAPGGPQVGQRMPGCVTPIGAIQVLSCLPDAGLLGGERVGTSSAASSDNSVLGDGGLRLRPLVTPPALPREPVYDRSGNRESDQGQGAEPGPETEPPARPAPELIYEPSPKHDQKRPGVAPQPTNPEVTLKEAVEVKPRQRIGYDTESGEIVVFRETHEEQRHYHGYVVEYHQLNQEQRNALLQAGLVNLRGKPMK